MSKPEASWQRGEKLAIASFTIRVTIPLLVQEWLRAAERSMVIGYRQVIRHEHMIQEETNIILISRDNNENNNTAYNITDSSEHRERHVNCFGGRPSIK